MSTDEASWKILDFYFDFQQGSGTANTSQGMLRSLLFQLVAKLESIGDYVKKRDDNALGDHWAEDETKLLNKICDAVNTQSSKISGSVSGLKQPVKIYPPRLVTSS